jgi:hypothetical protein
MKREREREVPLIDLKIECETDSFVGGKKDGSR